jgi:2-oxoglutarate ferredoxin oxidoreductase subunit alpha
VIKVNSYIHDEAGITTERSDLTTRMTDKRILKEKTLRARTESLSPVEVFGRDHAPITILCWGSTLPGCREVAGTLGFRVVQPVVLSPFPVNQLKTALSGSERIIAIEENALGQLVMLCARNGISVDEAILKYDGRPFSIEELERRLSEVT